MQEKTEEKEVLVQGKYRLIRKIGSGAFGDVFEGKYIPHLRH